MPSVLQPIEYKPTGIAGDPHGRPSIESLQNWSVLQGQQSVLGAGTHAPVPEIGAPAPPADPSNHREFVNPKQTRKLIYDRVLDQMQKIGPIANARHTLELRDPRYIDPEDIDLDTQKKAILTGRSLHRRIKGTWRLTDNVTGQPLDEKEMTIAAVPHLTPRGTFVIRGTEYTLSNQMRLRPGIFTRVKENGEIESHVNVMPGNGISHRYFLDPETGIFKINIGQAKLPLYPILRAIGISDTQLRKSWGDELLGANMQAPDGKSVTKLYQRLVRKPNADATPEERAQTLEELFHKMRLDPEVTKRTLGVPHEYLTKDAILDTTKKLIRVSRKEEEPDDRDHLAFQTLHGPEDLMSERITKDKAYLRQLLWKSSFKGNLSAMQPGALTRQLHSTIMHTGLGQAAEEINPAELLDAQGRATRLGEGGIGSMEAVPDEARSVQPSHFAYIDPVRTPESFKVGVDTRITHAARKGADGRIYAPFTDVKSGQTKYLSPQDVADIAVAFPGELEKKKPYVAAMVGGTTRFVPRNAVSYVLPHFENAFSPLANMIPGKSGLKGQRMAMGSRYLAQALPMVNRESPYLQAAMPGQHMQHSFEDEYGKHMGAVRAHSPGTVKRVTKNGVLVQHDDGSRETYELYNHFPFSRKTFIHNEPVVKAGQRVGPNDLLARSNYTDENGTTALGLNARIAFVPYRGANYEDAAVISQSMAKRMTSEHMYQHDQEWNDKIKKGLKPFISLFPTEYERPQLAHMDEHGVVKPGTVVKFGDPLVLVAEERERTHSQIHRGRKPSFANKTLTWDHHGEGVVTDVAHTGGGVTVAVKAHVPMQVGDKLSNRYGGKGVVAEILPDEGMPHDESGTPYEIALNPLGMISRINPIQIHETILGKIANKTGRPYKLEDFANINDLTEFTKQEMQKHGVKDTETIIDPETGRRIPNVLTGHQFILKLHHTSETKGQGRGIGGYTAEEIPAKGGADGSKRIALLETNALLSHGATEFLRDAHLVRGQKNDQYWQAFMSGFRPPEPEVPLVYRKFVDSLRAGGINVVRNGRQLHIMALTDKDVDKLAGDRYVQNTDTVDWKEGLKPRRGGFFDPALTGGHGGNRWSAIKLHEPMPNPAFEEPIRRMLGLTQKKFEAVIAGQEPVGDFGSGPKAIKDALDHIDLRKAIRTAETEVKSSKKGVRDDAIRKLKFLKDAERVGVHPRDWILSKAPVLPPIFRPVSVMAATGTQQIADANYLYKELFDANDVLQQAKHAGLGDLSHERVTAYKALKGVVGLGEPITPKNQERQVKGILQHVFGTSPKFGMVQRQLLGSTVELVGRAVITPNPDLDMDHVGLPENKAWEVYKPFVIRRLVQHGVPRLEAARAFKDQLPIARDAMLQEMKERPVVISRAPVLHRYGIMGFWPTLVKGDVMQIPPITTKGFNADFDGDTMNYHVPATEEAKKEVIEKLLPSRNLISAADFNVHYTPSMEYQGGLYHATTAKSDRGRPVIFHTKQDALRAYHDGRISLDTLLRLFNTSL
jgi:DNA-directed RNA polymerase beta subunit